MMTLKVHNRRGPAYRFVTSRDEISAKTEFKVIFGNRDSNDNVCIASG